MPGAVDAYDYPVPNPPTPKPFVPDNKPIIATNETTVNPDGTVSEPSNITDPELPNEGLLKQNTDDNNTDGNKDPPSSGSTGLLIGLLIAALIFVIIGVIYKVRSNSKKDKTFATGAAERALVADKQDTTEEAEIEAPRGGID